MKKLVVVYIFMLLFVGGCARLNIERSVYSDILSSTINEVGLSESYGDIKQELFKNIYNDLDGTWLNVSFIRNIKDKKYLFDNCEWPSSIIYSYDNDKNQYNWVKNFEEDSVPGKIDKIIISRASEGATLIINDKENIKANIDKDGIISMTCFNVVFHKIDCSVDEYINRYTLFGKYKDNNAIIYEFSEDNRAIWPDRTFNYNFGLSYFSDKNIITVLNADELPTDQYYAFEFIDDKLYLYETYPDSFFISIKESPFLILEKIE